MITIQKSYELFIDTMSRLDECKLTLNDVDLTHEIFEELDSEYHSFLHQWTVDRLIQAGLIPTILRERILTLRENISPVMEEKHLIEQYRNDPDWKKVRIEANALLNEVKNANRNR